MSEYPSERSGAREKIYISKKGEQTHRGTAYQLYKRYKELAESTMDRVEAELYLQHAEHYNRLRKP